MRTRHFPTTVTLPIVIAAFVAIGALLYGTSLTHDFIALDDDMVIFRNPIVMQMTPRTIWQAFTTYDPELYVPLTVVSLQLSWIMGGGEPWAFHAGNVLLHIGNALLVAWLLGLLLRQRWAGIICGLAYLVHPLNVEAVAWASARKDVLSAAFGFGSCIAYVHGIRGWRQGRRVSLELFLCALLAKVSVIALPFWFIIFEWIEHRKVSRGTMMRLWPFFVLAAVFGVIAIVGKPQGVSGLPLYTTLAIGAKAAMQYISHAAIPSHLSIAYELMGPRTMMRPDLLLSIIGCIALALLAYSSKKNIPLLSAGIAMYGIALVPTFFNVLKGHTVYFASDRYVYIALAGLLLGAAATVLMIWQRMPRLRVLLAVTGAVIIGSWTVISWRTIGLWQDSTHIFEHALHVSPDSAMILNNVGNAYIAAGDAAKAETLYRNALARYPNWATLHMNLATALERQHRDDEAIIILQYVIATYPSDRAEAYYRLGNLFARLQQKQQALAAYKASMEIDSSFVLGQFGNLPSE